MGHNLYVKYKTVKFRDDNIGENLDDLGYSNGFLDTTWSMKVILDKLNYIKFF